MERCFRAVGIDEVQGRVPFHAGLQVGCVDLCFGGDGKNAFAAQTVLLVEQAGIQLPIAVLLSGTACRGSCRQGVGVEGQRQILVNKSDQAGIDVLAFELWHHLFVEATAVAALKITEFHDGEWCAWVTQSRFPVQQQRTGQQRDCSIMCLVGLAQVLVEQPFDHDRAPNSKGDACQKSDHAAMWNLHGAFCRDQCRHADGIGPRMPIEWQQLIGVEV